MKIADTLERNPLLVDLVNRGQARIPTEATPESHLELRRELESFVCDGEYGRAVSRVLGNFLQRLHQGSRQDSAWISGFFGSGKSHLLKILGHLWCDTRFPDGSSARTLVRGLPEEAAASLKELDVQARRAGVPLVSCAGTLPAGSADHVRATILSVILRSRGLPEEAPHARFQLWLRDEGRLDVVRAEIEASGRSWIKELGDLYVSRRIAEALVRHLPGFAADAAAARQLVQAQFPALGTDLTTPQFLDLARRALAEPRGLPFTILVLDEVQQYIGEALDRAVTVTEVAEAVQTELDGRVLLVASGQSALSMETKTLQKLTDRFRVTAQLSDADVEAVTRKVVLAKLPSAMATIQSCLDRHSGEIDRHLRNTRLARRPEDHATILQDYPLLPTRRRFYEECFRAIDKEGLHSQLRSQLRILHDAVFAIADREVGAVIPGERLYDALAPDMANKGLLLNEIQTRIQRLDDGTPKGRLRRRIAAVVFLISRLPKDGDAHLGIRPDAATIADLLVEDLTTDSGPLRRDVDASLKELAAEGVLMEVGGSYRIQTRQGSEWEGAYRERAHALGQNETEIATRRDQLFRSAVLELLGRQKIPHGQVKLQRPLRLHAGAAEPPAGQDGIVVWLRDGWSTSESEVLNDVRRRGNDDPLVHVFIEKQAADELRRLIVDVEACQRVLEQKGVPTEAEGYEARKSMESRRDRHAQDRDAIVKELVHGARVLQGGGTDVFGATLTDRVHDAASASLARLYPRFPDGDSARWEVALKHARDGSDEPFAVVGWTRPVVEHPVAKELLAQIGAASTGTRVRKILEGVPFGWPADAVDAAIVALHRLGHLRVRLNGLPLAPGQLDQTKIKSAELAPERVVLSTQQRVQVRGLISRAVPQVKPGEEEAKAPVFLDAVESLAQASGGPAPCPPPLDASCLDASRGLFGAEQLASLLDRRAAIETLIQSAEARKDLLLRRLPVWRTLEELLAQATGLAVAAELRPEVEAIRARRALLEGPDLVTPLVARLATALRAEVTARHRALLEAHLAAERELAADPAWNRLSKTAQQELRGRHQLEAPEAPRVDSDEHLLATLRVRGLGARADAVLAVPKRVHDALGDAVRSAQPTARSVRLARATLTTAAEVDAWIEAQRAALHAAITTGPVIVG